MDTDKRKRVGVRAVSVVLIALASVLYYQTYSFPVPLGLFGSDYGSAFFPRIMLGLIIVCSIALLVQSLIKRKVSGSADGLGLDRTQLLRVAAVWLICAGFFWIWKYTEFLYASTLFMIAVALLLGVRRVMSLFFLAAIAPLLYFVFQQVLRVSL